MKVEIELEDLPNELAGFIGCQWHEVAAYYKSEDGANADGLTRDEILRDVIDLVRAINESRKE